MGLAIISLAGIGMAQSYYRRDLPDYDQRRNDLPNNGRMYCVPTSYADILRFMATKSGFTNLDAHFNGGYGDITVFIYQLGLLMDTDSGGTNFGDGVDAIEDWIDDHSNQRFDHTVFLPDTNWGTQRLRHTMAMGWMARLGISFYYKQGSGSTWEQDGGHAVALAGYDYRNADKVIIYANPWTGDDDSINAQSTSGLGSRVVTNTPINTDDYGRVTHAIWNKETKDGKRWERMIDKMHVINPKWAGWVNAPFTTTPPPPLMASISEEEPIPFGATTFHAVFPQQMSDGVNPVVRERDIVLPGPVKDWCIDPGQAAIYILLLDGSIHHVDLLDKVTEPVTTIKGARKLAVAGKKFELFVLQDGDKEDNLIRFDIDSKAKTSMKVAKGITALEPDQETRGVAALHPTSKRLFRIDPDLKRSRPQALELPNGDGPVLMNVGRKGEVTLVRSGSAGFTRTLSEANVRRFVVAQETKARSIQALGKDRFLIQDGERLITVNSDGTMSSSAFDNIQATGIVRLSHGWMPFTKAEVSGRKWRDVPPGDDGK